VPFDSLPSPGTGNPAADLDLVVERIAATGHRPLAVDITPVDVAQAGLTVVRALVPGYHPLIMGYPIRAKGGRRLWSVPQALGYPGIDPATGDNPLPHPFP
jgi:ribosomal protein S12 methylthiotransferase accessory factor